MDNATKLRIIEVLENETHVSINTIAPQVPIREQINIDSMQFITILARLEVTFSTTIPTTIMGISTLNELFDELDKVLRQE